MNLLMICTQLWFWAALKPDRFFFNSIVASISGPNYFGYKKLEMKLGLKRNVKETSTIEYMACGLTSKI